MKKKKNNITINHKRNLSIFGKGKKNKQNKKLDIIVTYLGQMAMHYVYKYIAKKHNAIHRNNIENMFICDRLHLCVPLWLQ